MQQTAMHAALFVMILFSLLIFTVRADDSIAMVKLAAAISPKPLGWSTNGTTNYCNWQGVQCSKSRWVNAIELPNRNLSGILPLQISSLSKLRVLSLQNNRLSGPLPSLAYLSSLEELYLNSNNFTSIPQNFFAGLINLRLVSIGQNRNLDPWTIPSEIGQCQCLEGFYASEANIVGSMPDIFASHPNLSNLGLSYNNLTGVLPGLFANSRINNLCLNSQLIGLSGTIDVLSSMIELTQVWLHGNQFTGSIPDLSRCRDLFDLQLKDNQFTGVVPASLTSLPSLLNVSLSNNRLQGPVPMFKFNVKASIGGNIFCSLYCDPQVNALLEIAGAIGYPATLFASWRGNNACSNWKFVTCDANRSIVMVNFTGQNFSGIISPAFGNLTYIRKLYLNENNLTGVIPEGLTKLPQLKILDVSNNNLTGYIPAFGSPVMVVLSGNPYLGASTEGEVITDSWFSSTERRGNRVLLVIISSAVISFAALAALVVLVFFKCKRKKRPSRMNDLKTGNPSFTFPSCDFNGENIQYSAELLQQMTDNFSENNIIGKGGFGTVYKGELQDGTEVAVKRMKTTAMSKVGKSNEFQAEISVLSKVRHRHLVSLLGYCESGNEGFLIYEFMPKGTLKQHLFEWHELGWPHLTWKQRVRIALDVARGLEYLHNLTEQSSSFIHRDIKPSNILLGDDMRAKISDFGLVKKSSDGLTSVETRVAGTFGYLAPEYIETGKVTKTVDVFAFGVILMEMITGRKAIDDTKEMEEEEWMDIHLVTWFRRALSNNNIYKEIDGILNPEENDLESIYKVAELAVRCAQDRPRQRPDIGYAVNFLVPLVEQWRSAPRTEESVSLSVSTVSDVTSDDPK